MELLNSGQTLQQKLIAHQPVFTELARRAERGRLDTKYGRKVYDSELREPYEKASSYMDKLLEQLFAQNAEIEFLKATGGVELDAPDA